MISNHNRMNLFKTYWTGSYLLPPQHMLTVTTLTTFSHSESFRSYKLQSYSVSEMYQMLCCCQSVTLVITPDLLWCNYNYCYLLWSLHLQLIISWCFLCATMWSRREQKNFCWEGFRELYLLKNSKWKVNFGDHKTDIC